MSTRQLLDPRWHWLRGRLEEMWLALDPDEKVMGLTLVTVSADGECLTTTATTDERDLDRRLISDESALLRVGEEMRDGSIELRPPAET